MTAMQQQGAAAKAASYILSTAGTAKKNAALEAIAEILTARSAEWLSANAEDAAAARASGLTEPSRRGGVTRTISLTPAIFAGITFIKIVEGNASGLRGTQMPTRSMGVHRWPITMPGRSVNTKPL